MYYRSKSYQIKAYRLDESAPHAAPFWFLDGIERRKIIYDSVEDDDGWHLYGCIVKNKGDVDLYANVGDYIILEPDNTFQVYKPAQFRRTFRRQDE